MPDESYRGPVNLDQLMNMDDYVSNGGSPFTILCFPCDSLDRHGLPSDPEAQQLLALFQRHGVKLGIWTLPADPMRRSFAAVAKSDGDSFMRLIRDLERDGHLKPGHYAKLGERLFDTVFAKR